MESSAPSPLAAFNPPEEAEWHRMISVAAYFLAEQRGFAAGRNLDDWLRAEQQIKDSISAPAAEPGR
jgi:hypothetical protein